MKFKSSKIYIDWVREFYNNMDIEKSGPVKTFVRGKWIKINAGDIANFVDIPVVENPEYPIPENLQVPIDYDLMAITICGADTHWLGGILPHGETDCGVLVSQPICLPQPGTQGPHFRC